MDPWLVGLAVVGVGALLFWILRPSQQRSAKDRRAGSVKVLAERGLEAVSRGLSVAVEDASLIDRFDFPPFGRGSNRAATEVLRGSVLNENVLVFNYSFALEGERRRRGYAVTVLDARFPWIGRLRLTSLPREGKRTVDFDDAWRLDEAPPGLEILTDRVRRAVMRDRFKASAIVVVPDAVVHIEPATTREFDLDRDIVLLKEIRAALSSA